MNMQLRAQPEGGRLAAAAAATPQQPPIGGGSRLTWGAGSAPSPPASAVQCAGHRPAAPPRRCATACSKRLGGRRRAECAAAAAAAAAGRCRLRRLRQLEDAAIDALRRSRPPAAATRASTHCLATTLGLKGRGGSASLPTSSMLSPTSRASSPLLRLLSRCSGGGTGRLEPCMSANCHGG